LKSWVTAQDAWSSSRPGDYRFRRCTRIAGVGLAAIVFVGSVGPASGVQQTYTIYTADDLTVTMRTLGPNVERLKRALAARDYETAKDQVARSRELLAPSITFWSDHARDDAIRLLKHALSRLDDLDVALSAETIDPTAVDARASAVDSACESCHKTYREEDPVTKERRLKRSVLK
jgi:hypothetical protein